jgi:hypothetical protein
MNSQLQFPKSISQIQHQVKKKKNYRSPQISQRNDIRIRLPGKKFLKNKNNQNKNSQTSLHISEKENYSPLNNSLISKTLNTFYKDQFSKENIGPLKLNRKHRNSVGYKPEKLIKNKKSLNRFIEKKESVRLSSSKNYANSKQKWKELTSSKSSIDQLVLKPKLPRHLSPQIRKNLSKNKKSKIQYLSDSKISTLNLLSDRSHSKSTKVLKSGKKKYFKQSFDMQNIHTSLSRKRLLSANSKKNFNSPEKTIKIDSDLDYCLSTTRLGIKHRRSPSGFGLTKTPKTQNGQINKKSSNLKEKIPLKILNFLKKGNESNENHLVYELVSQLYQENSMLRKKLDENFKATKNVMDAFSVFKTSQKNLCQNKREECEEKNLAIRSLENRIGELQGKLKDCQMENDFLRNENSGLLKNLEEFEWNRKESGLDEGIVQQIEEQEIAFQQEKDALNIEIVR